VGVFHAITGMIAHYAARYPESEFSNGRPWSTVPVMDVCQDGSDWGANLPEDATYPLNLFDDV